MDSLHDLTLGDVLREHGRSHPQAQAAVCGKTRLTYRQLDGRVNRLARALQASGFKPGDRLLWLGQTCHRLFEALLAAAKLGGIFCPANWRGSAEEIAFVLDDLDPRVVLWQQGEIGATFIAARERSRSQATWLQHDGEGPGSYEAALAAATEEDVATEVDPASPVVLLYTAAFDGKPNGCQLSHTALILQALVTSKLKDLSAETVYLNSGPLFHPAGLSVTAATFLWAGKNVFLARAEPEEICRLIEAERCTGALLMPPTVESIVRLNREKRFDLKSLKSYAASPEWNAMVTLDDSPAARKPGGYGQTECTGHLTFGALGAGAQGSSGRPMPLAQVRIIDPSGKDVPAGEVGEIIARGPTVMIGYWGRADATARRLQGGWHHTGDLGRREQDGSISFIGTKQRLIKSAAENIYPAEVETCLRAHPSVAECGVIGVPDPTWAQSVKAIVALKPGQSATAEALIEHCRQRLASYKKPRTVEFVDALPKKAGGIDYAALDQRFGGGGYPGA
jgi:acyl-CoA synthetase (AMP-forming)/AMP-acid ligase II